MGSCGRVEVEAIKIKLDKYISKLSKKKGSRNWEAVQKLLDEGPKSTLELSSLLGWSYARTSMIVYRMRQAGLLEKRARLITKEK